MFLSCIIVLIIIKFSLACTTLVSQMEKKHKVKKNAKAEINNDIEKNTKSKKYSKILKKQYRFL